MKKRIISFIIVCLLSLSCLTVLSSADAQLSNANDVITPELREVMNASKAADKIPVSIWTDEIDAAEVEELALKKTGFNKASIRALVEQGKGDTVTLDDVNEYIAVERKLYAEKQQSANKKFAEKYTFLNEAKTQKDAYVCSYAPMIVVSLTKSQIETLAKDSVVNTMYYSPRTEYVEQMAVSLPLINANYTRDTLRYTGSGVKVGIVERGIPSTIDIPLNTVIVDYYPDDAEYSEHAQAVAEIIASNKAPLRGIAPDVDMYCAQVFDDIEFIQGVEWLITKGVSVINISGALDTTGYYGEYDRWADHIAHNHSVHLVIAAGNETDNSSGGVVTSPGLAYNAITVGAINDGGTATNLSDDVLCTFSSYIERSAVINGVITKAANKPDVVASGLALFTSSFPDGQFEPERMVSGTSFSAPHVTGVVAQLIQQYPSLAVLQDLMKAMLTAAISHDYISYTPYQTSLFEKYGAGLVDAKACSEISYRGTFVSSTFTAAQSNYTKTYTFNATTSDNKIRVSLAWLKSVWFSGSDHLSNTTPGTNAPLANLDLIIVRPNGTELPMCQYENYDLNTNLVIIEFDPEVYGYGTYTVKVKIHDSTGKATYFGLAWWANRN